MKNPNEIWSKEDYEMFESGQPDSQLGEMADIMRARDNYNDIARQLTLDVNHYRVLVERATELLRNPLLPHVLDWEERRDQWLKEVEVGK